MSPPRSANSKTGGEALEDPTFYVGLGLAVKELRERQGLSRKSLSIRSGVSYPYLSEIETGKKRMSARALLHVSRGLNVKPYELLEAAEGWISGAHPVPDQLDATKVTAEIIERLAHLGLEDLLALREVINRLVLR